MAILAGGNPVGGSNPSGIGKGLNYIGNHVYGYSGVIAVGQPEVALIDTEIMGTGYTILTCNFGTSSISSRSMQWNIYIDEQKVFSYVTESHQANAPVNPQNEITILVPGYAKFKIATVNLDDANTESQSVLVTGRFYQ